jgi:NitT/TauT family transport system permease protein
VSAAAQSPHELRLHDEIGRRAAAREAVSRASIAAARAAAFAVALGAWAFASGHLADRQFISDPLEVLRAFWMLVATGRLWPNLIQTLAEVLSGYAIGAVLGIVVAVAVAFQETAQSVLRPFLIAFYSIPKIALAPLFIMWFGLGPAPKIVLAAIFVFFVVFMNMVAGLYQVSPDLVNVVRVMGARRIDVVRKIALPSVVPYLMTGLRIAVPEALIGAVIGEFMSANAGLGYLVNTAAQQFNTAATLAAIVALLLIVAAMDVALGLLEHRLLGWRPRGDLVLAAKG